MSQIKNIIFDLGGVIINLDIPKTISEFNKLSPKPFEGIYTQIQQSSLFDKFDKGQITEDSFFSELKLLLNNNVSYSQMLFAWNTMLLDFPQERLKMLLELKKTYRIFLLSNTNETHVTEFEKQLLVNNGYKNLEPFFEKVYYSCRMNMRKPDAEIFNFVLNQNNLNANETLFIDDSPQHVKGALKTGIIAHLLPNNKDIIQLLKELKIIKE